MTAPDPRAPIGLIPPLPRTADTPGAVAARMDAVTLAWQDLLTGTPTARLDARPHPHGWTITQLAHHTADAHAHGLNRLKYALTTPAYTIQPFDQDAWLTLPDATLPVQDALDLLRTTNRRWTTLLRALSPAQLDTSLTHPQEGPQTLWDLTAKHDWHLRHHLAQAQLALGVSP
ncbi:DinB family protein [Deinococcus radiotolerans]|uniref:DinB-like domain-containing protein n=1 Tax=Deinococcus radiotolerans TaxID=1309407 RepID=A0ABQ2FM82_9DEIO|nr:DinB family protein [Deinococcus radiotolerans]GGL06932.1 hypothetical protein GCM10010844_27160 [Deinococcus radiotolerans]